MAELIWYEKYRPKEFSDVVGLDPAIPASINSSMQHMLFEGTAGTGKTTTAKIIAKKLKCDLLELNASDERGIDVIREKVKKFAMTKSSNGNFKLVYLDEADALTPDAQTALRNMMETYVSNCRFILSLNYLDKIIDPIQSRCKIYRFKTERGASFAYLGRIVTQEKLLLKDDVLWALIERSKGDLRKAVNTLQSLSTLNREIVMDDVVIRQTTELPEKIHELLKAGEYTVARQIMLDSNVNYEGFLNDYHDFINNEFFVTKNLSSIHYGRMIDLLWTAMSVYSRCISKEIVIEKLFKDAIGALK